MIGAALVLAAALSAPTPRPAWCQAGWVCIPTKEAAELTVRLADLSAEVEALKARRARHFGFTIGPSLSIVYEPLRLEDGGLSGDWHVGPGASLVWGLRF